MTTTGDTLGMPLLAAPMAWPSMLSIGQKATKCCCACFITAVGRLFFFL
jgi:hypothetical protein